MFGRNLNSKLQCRLSRGKERVNGIFEEGCGGGQDLKFKGFHMFDLSEGSEKSNLRKYAKVD